MPAFTNPDGVCLVMQFQNRNVICAAAMVLVASFAWAADPAEKPAEDKVLANGILTVNNGSYQCVDDHLKSASQIIISGAFRHGDKYPMGGSVDLGNSGWPAVTTLPDRLNHDCVLVFNGGGYFQYLGQALAAELKGKVVAEQIKQIQFNSGLSEMRFLLGNGSSGTTLLVNDPTNSLIRKQGATAMIGGDDKLSAQEHYEAAMGSAEKLIFASGMSSHLKGGGGAPGSKNVSVIPWMTIGTIYHPGRALATYDSVNGIRSLAPSEWYNGPALDAPADANLKNSSLSLGTNKAQTVNCVQNNTWENYDIGLGSVLTITSGCLSFDWAPGKIGMGNPANAGTLNFGPAEGVIWSSFVSGDGENAIGSVITGSGGLTVSGTGRLVLTAANTYTGKTCVASGILEVGDGKLTTPRLGNGDVEVANGAVLRIKGNVANAIADTATVTLCNAGKAFFGRLDLGDGVKETVGGLVVGGVAQPAGTYGSSASAAEHKLDSYFSGSGILTVTASAAGGNRAEKN